MISFQIPGEPVAKARPRFLRAVGRKPFPDHKTTSYEAVVKQTAALAMRGREPFTGPLRLTIRATYLWPASWSAKKRAATVWKTSKPDFDNIAKIVDALNKVVWTDDAAVSEAIIQKRYGGVASLVVSVEQLSNIGAA